MTKEMIKYFFTLQFVPCHRKKERSFMIGTWQFPLCYRCMAILLGYVYLPIMIIFEYSFPLWFAIAIHFPMLIDGTAQRIGIHNSNNFLRFWTGLLCGIGQSMLIIYISRYLTAIIMMQ